MAKLWGKNISYCDRGFLLRCRCDMGIGVQGEAGGEVAQDGGYGLDVHAVLQSDGGKGVAEVVEANLGDACPCQHPFQHIVHTVRGNGVTGGGREYIFAVGFCFLLFEDFYRLG